MIARAGYANRYERRSAKTRHDEGKMFMTDKVCGRSSVLIRLGLYSCILFLLFFGIIGLYHLEDFLLKRGLLNTKDCVADQPCTFLERLTNIWHWDGALLFLTILAAIIGIVIVVKMSLILSGHDRRKQQVGFRTDSSIESGGKRVSYTQWGTLVQIQLDSEWEKK